jgi:hypothetical protein
MQHRKLCGKGKKVVQNVRRAGGRAWARLRIEGPKFVGISGHAKVYYVQHSARSCAPPRGACVRTTRRKRTFKVPIWGAPL